MKPSMKATVSFTALLIVLFLTGCTVHYLAGTCAKATSTVTLMDGSSQVSVQEQCR